jgi:PKD repeat protein
MKWGMAFLEKLAGMTFQGRSERMSCRTCLVVVGVWLVIPLLLCGPLTTSMASACTISCSVSGPGRAPTGTWLSFGASVTPSNCTGSVSYSWRFGDGSTSASQNPTWATTAASPSSSIWSVTASVGGMQCQQGGRLNLGGDCTAGSTASGPSSGQTGQSLSFTSIAGSSNCGLAGSDPVYDWDFGDGQSSSSQNPTHAYSSAGTYNWTLTAGLSSRFGSVTITAAPVCTIGCSAAGPSGGQTGQSLSFTSSATPSNCTGSVGYTWSFGDGSTSASQNPSHAYSSAGTYSWVLTMSIGSTQCQKTGNVTITAAPVCTIGCSAAGPSGGQTGQSLSFTSSATPSNCTGSVGYTWSFGDGSTSASQNPSHAYSSAGTYSWVLTTSIGSTQCQKTGNVTITATPTCTGFSISPTSANASSAAGSTLVTVTGSPAGCHGGSWNATGNGDWISVSPPSGSGSGFATVSWTANSSPSGRSGNAFIAGQSFGVMQDALTGSPLQIAPSANPVVALVGQAIAFSAGASGGTSPYYYSWVFSDGGPGASSPNPTRAFSQAGNYVASLTVTDSVGAQVKGNVAVEIFLGFGVSPSVSPTDIYLGLPVQFTATVVGGTPPYEYYWTFSDGQGATHSSTPVRALSAGDNTAYVSVIDSTGKTVQGSVAAYVFAAPPAQVRVWVNGVPPCSNGGTGCDPRIFIASIGDTLTATRSTPRPCGSSKWVYGPTAVPPYALNEGVPFHYSVAGTVAVGEEGYGPFVCDFSELRESFRSTASGLGTVVSSTSGCAGSESVLCLLSGRFRVTADVRDYSGKLSLGHAVPITSDTGYFWFVDAANVEVVAKIVSFCGSSSNNVAVYAAGLTDLDINLHIMDSRTGMTRDYHNALGSGFILIRDGPFSCPAGVTEIREDGSLIGDASLASSRTVQAKSGVQETPTIDTVCSSDATTLCLLGGRFQVRAGYQDYGGKVGTGQAVALTPDTGYFWFFDSANVEVISKMVSFCGGGTNNIGIYTGGLTDIGVTLTVLDTRTGLVKTYTNAVGNPFQLIRDGPFTCQ